MQDDISDDIQRCHQAIDTLVQNFQVRKDLTFR